MKNFKTTLIISVLLLSSVFGYAQDVETSLDEARKAYKSGNLEEARYALQQAVNEVDLAMAREIQKLLPATLGGMPFTEEDETVGSASLGFAGLFVSRTYRTDENTSANLQIMADSPMLAGINAILSIPMLGSDPNQKRVRLEGYKGILSKTEHETGDVSWDLQLPFGSSLLTINFNGINDEKSIMEMADAIEVEKIAKMLQ